MLIRKTFTNWLNFSLILLLGVIGITGCTNSTAVPPIPTEPPATSLPVPATATQAPPAARLLVVDPAGITPPDVTDYLSTFALENGLGFETITDPELPPQAEDTRMVVFLAEPANLAEIVAASPATQFIVYGSPETITSPNLSILRANSEDLAFMAGYLTMLISWDWRAAGVIPTDVVMAAEKADAFENGARYVCGQCTPFYPPLVYFPLLAQESIQADSAAWDARINELSMNYVNSYYIDPALATPEMLDRIRGLSEVIHHDIYLVGLENSSAPESVTALLGFELLSGLQQLIPQALAGTGGLAARAQVTIIASQNNAIVTPAKVDNFNRVAADLAAGIIIPLSIP